jgi:hypothetical protein
VRFAAQQKPHRPGFAPALGLRAGGDGLVIPLQTVFREKPGAAKLSLLGGPLMWFFPSLRSLPQRLTARHARPNRPATHLVLEPLEDRMCPSGGYLVVGSFSNNSVLRYDESTGAFVDQFDPHNLANLKTPGGGVFGSDGNLYVSGGAFFHTNQVVVQYNGTTGSSQGVFASQNITSPRAVLFGPDGNLYVADGNDAASGDPASVERFDGKTGAFLGYFVDPTSNGGLTHPSDMVFGPDGAGGLDLYVAAGHEGAIYRYDGTTGAFKGVFVSAASGGLDNPWGMVFGADGDLYVASSNFFTSSNGPFYSGDFPPGAVLRFEGFSGQLPPGTFLGTFVPGGSGGLATPTAMLFGPDGDLYVASCVQYGRQNILAAEPGTSEVLRYDGTTGAFLGTFVTPDSGGLHFPTFLAFTETDPTTLNYDGATPSTALAATTTSTPMHPAATTPMTNTASPLIASSNTSPIPLLASSPTGSSSIDPAALSVSLSLSQLPTTPRTAAGPALSFTPIPLLTLSLTGNLPPTSSSQAGSAAETAAHRVLADFGAGVSLARLGDDLALTGGRSEDLTPPSRWE